MLEKGGQELDCSGVGSLPISVLFLPCSELVIGFPGHVGLVRTD